MDDFDWKTFLLSFDGRITRSDYWLRFVLPEFAISVGLDELDSLTDSAIYGIGLFGFLFALVSLWPATAITVKRCHDRARSGQYLCAGLFPLLGALWLFIDLGFLRGTVGTNRYGPDPLAGNLAEAE